MDTLVNKYVLQGSVTTAGFTEIYIRWFVGWDWYGHKIYTPTLGRSEECVSGGAPPAGQTPVTELYNLPSRFYLCDPLERGGRGGGLVGFNPRYKSVGRMLGRGGGRGVETVGILAGNVKFSNFRVAAILINKSDTSALCTN